MSILPLSGLATALGLGFQGYGQDQATLIQRQRQQVLDQQAAARFGTDQQLAQSQIADTTAQAGQRTALSAATALKTQANQRAYNALKTTQPDHPLAQLPYDDTTDYTGELKASQAGAVKAKQAQAANMAGYNAYKNAFPTDPAVQQPFDPNSPINFAELFKEKRQQSAQDALAARGKNIDPNSDVGIAQRIKLAQGLASAKTKVQTPDQIKSQTVLALSDPAANILLAYHGGNGGLAQTTAGVASHLPLVGNYLSGKVDPEYQNAMNAARTLATQYLDIMPKGRFQPSTVDDIMSQIAPNVSDAAPVKATKLARVKELQKAIQKRAANPTDAPGLTLDDAPPPPGTPQ